MITQALGIFVARRRCDVLECARMKVAEKPRIFKMQILLSYNQCNGTEVRMSREESIVRE